MCSHQCKAIVIFNQGSLKVISFNGSSVFKRLGKAPLTDFLERRNMKFRSQK